MRRLGVTQGADGRAEFRRRDPQMNCRGNGVQATLLDACALLRASRIQNRAALDGPTCGRHARLRSHRFYKDVVGAAFALMRSDLSHPALARSPALSILAGRPLPACTDRRNGRPAGGHQTGHTIYS